MTKYFVTGGSGFIGTSLIQQLIIQGFEVSALARSSKSSEKIKSINESIEIIHGSLEDFDIITRAVKDSDGVIHLAHNLQDMQNANLIDSKVVEVISDALTGSNKPFVYATGFASYAGFLNETQTKITEDMGKVIEKIPAPFSLRVKTEHYVLSLKDKGVRSASVRLPLVHGENDPNFLKLLIDLYKANGFVGALDPPVGNSFAAISKIDAARLFIIAAEKGKAGSVYHAVGEESLSADTLLDFFSKGLNLPIKKLSFPEIQQYLGLIGVFTTINFPASAERTRDELGWEPVEPGLLEDLEKYYL